MIGVQTPTQRCIYELDRKLTSDTWSRPLNEAIAFDVTNRRRSALSKRWGLLSYQAIFQAVLKIYRKFFLHIFLEKKTFLVVSNTCHWCEILRQKKTVQNNWMNLSISYLFYVFCGILDQRKEQVLTWKYVKAWNNTLRYMYDTIPDKEKLYQKIYMESRSSISFDVNQKIATQVTNSVVLNHGVLRNNILA